MADMRLLALTHLVAAGFGFAIAPRELLETEVKHSGFFKTDTKRVLAAAVESLRAERRLAVFSFKGFAAVSVERDGFLFLDGHQDLIVPASIIYFADLSRIEATLDESSNIVLIRLQPLTMSDVAFEPEGAKVRSGGVLAWSAAQVEELNKLNYRAARRAFHKQSQGRALVDTAMAEAKKAVSEITRTTLRIAGRPDLNVIVTFEKS